MSMFCMIWALFPLGAQAIPLAAGSLCSSPTHNHSVPLELIIPPQHCLVVSLCEKLWPQIFSCFPFLTRVSAKYLDLRQVSLTTQSKDHQSGHCLTMLPFVFSAFALIWSYLVHLFTGLLFDLPILETALKLESPSKKRKKKKKKGGAAISTFYEVSVNSLQNQARKFQAQFPCERGYKALENGEPNQTT